MSPQVRLPDEVVRKVVEQSPQGVLAIWMRVSRDSNHLARHHLYSHPHVDPARLVQCLEVQHRWRSCTPTPKPIPTADLIDADVDADGDVDGDVDVDVDADIDIHAHAIPIPNLRDNLTLTYHLHLISLPFPPDPDLSPLPAGPPKSKVTIIRRSIDMLTDFELHARAGPAERGYRGLFPNLQTLTVGITGRDVMMRDDLPGGMGRLEGSRRAECGPGPVPVPMPMAELSRGSVLSDVKKGDQPLSPVLHVPFACSAGQGDTAEQDQRAHNEIQRIRMSILGQKGAVIAALQRFVAIVEPPVTYATQDCVWTLPVEGLRREDGAYAGGMV